MRIYSKYSQMRVRGKFVNILRIRGKKKRLPRPPLVCFKWFRGGRGGGGGGGGGDAPPCCGACTCVCATRV